jgi:RNA polymerase sigma-70 factor, ECF subfamily
VSQEFERLVGPYRSKLRLHCYRMLGSTHESEDMVQETLARAYRAFDSLEDPAAVRGWLHRIATNVCLDEIAKRPKARARGPELGPAADPTKPPPDATPDEEWIEPVPSAWLEPLDPAASYTLKESVALAFVASLQLLTASQRAVLLLRDVVGLSAEETAAALGCSVSAANSTLHRARAAIEASAGPRASWSPEERAPVDRALLERYLAAWRSGEVSEIVALLHDDVVTSMPPLPMWFGGRAAVHRFYASHLAPALGRRVFHVRPVDIAGELGAAFYREDGKIAKLFALQSLEAREDRFAVVDHFMARSALTAFVAAGLPATIDLP